MKAMDKVNAVMDSGSLLFSSPGSFISRPRARIVACRLYDYYDDISQEELLSIIKNNNFRIDEIVKFLNDAEFHFSRKMLREYPVKKLQNVVKNEITYNQLIFPEQPFQVYPTKKLDWNPGDYGDFNSCYWGSKSTAKDMILREGGFAFKIHQDHTRIGRCWGVFLTKENPSNPPLLIFNSYMTSGYGNSLEYFADILQRILGYKEYYKVSLMNNGGGGNNILFINKNEGILLSDDLTKFDDLRIDLRWKEIRNIACALCRNRIEEANAFSVEERLICIGCAATEAFTCFNCDEYFFTRNGQKIKEEGKERQFCFNCFGELFAFCREDNKVYRKTDLVQIDYGDFCARVNLENFKGTLCKVCQNYNHSRRNWCWHCGDHGIKQPSKTKAPKRKKITKENVVDLFDFQEEAMKIYAGDKSDDE